MSAQEWEPDPVDVHTFFGLSYANYLVLARSVLQSMPMDWQHRFTAVMRELDEATWDLDSPASYSLQARDENGKFMRDPIPHYNRGRTVVDLAIPPSPVFEERGTQ